MPPVSAQRCLASCSRRPHIQFRRSLESRRVSPLCLAAANAGAAAGAGAMAVAEVRPSIPPRTCPPLNAIPAPPPPPVLSRRAHLHKQPGIALQDLADARRVKDPQICNSKHCSYRCDLCQPTPPALGRSVTGCAVNAPGSAVCTVLTDQPRSSRDGDAVKGSPRWPGAEA